MRTGNRHFPVPKCIKLACGAIVTTSAAVPTSVAAATTAATCTHQRCAKRGEILPVDMDDLLKMSL